MGTVSSISERRRLVNLEDARRRLQGEDANRGPVPPHPFAETDLVLRCGRTGAVIRRYRPTPSGWVEVIK